MDGESIGTRFVITPVSSRVRPASSTRAKRVSVRALGALAATQVGVLDRGRRTTEKFLDLSCAYFYRVAIGDEFPRRSPHRGTSRSVTRERLEVIPELVDGRCEQAGTPGVNGELAGSRARCDHRPSASLRLQNRHERYVERIRVSVNITGSEKPLHVGMRHLADQTNALSEPESADLIFNSGPTRPVTDNKYEDPERQGRHY
jgi:hypothetical protein